MLLITIDVVQLSIKAVANNKVANLPVSFTSCDNCPKPDVYLIIADEYAGQTELKDLFQNDNKISIINNFKTNDSSTGAGIIINISDKETAEKLSVQIEKLVLALGK